VSGQTCPWCKGTSNHAPGYDCRAVMRLDPLDALRAATTIEFQRINAALRALREEVDQLKKEVKP
jgi:hypothetical protein